MSGWAREGGGAGSGRWLGPKGPEGGDRGDGAARQPPAPRGPPLAWVLSNCSRSASRLWPGLRLSTRAGTFLILFILPPPALPGPAPRE